MPARLILNADDFGLTNGINRAVAELHDAGVLTSATLMANGQAFAGAVAIARDRPTLGVGAHIVLTDGLPVSHAEAIPSLLGADGKHFRPSLLDFVQALLRGTISEDEIAIEALAQIQKIQRAGIDITHLDTHKHTHLFPAVARPLLHLADRCGIGGIRNPFEPPWSFALGHGSTLRRLQVRMLSRLRSDFDSQPHLLKGNVLTTGGTIGISATGHLDGPTLAQILRALPSTGTCELCCHPGYNDSDLDRIATRLRHHRVTERRALLTEVPEALAHAHPPELIHYGHLGRFGALRETGQFTPNTGYEKIL